MGSSGTLLGVIGRKKAERMLVDLVNLNGGDGEVKAFLSQYPEFSRPLLDTPEEQALMAIAFVRMGLANAWADKNDLWKFDWHLRDTIEWYRIAAGDPIDRRILSTEPKRTIPKPTPFEAAILHFRQNAVRARRCAAPTCTAPFFFAGKQGQKYCSERCGAPVKLESKRRWWNENRGVKARKGAANSHVKR
jgi:hypothetical protein